MSGPQSSVPERDALMLQLLDRLLGRFDTVEDGLEALKAALDRPQRQGAAAPDIEVQTEAMRRIVAKAASDGAVSGIDARRAALSDSVAREVKNSLMDAQSRSVRLLNAFEGQMERSRKWGLQRLLLAALGGLLLGALITMALWIYSDASRFKKDIRSPIFSRTACAAAGGLVHPGDGENADLCYFAMP